MGAEVVMKKCQVILASGSPRRKELLGLIFPDFTVQPSPFDEKSLNPADFSPERLVETLSRCKAETVYNTFCNDNTDCIPILVVGGDTVVVSPDGEVMGKPASSEDAARMLRTLSGRCHRVITGVSFFYRDGEKQKAKTFSVETKVWFYPLSESEISGYLDSGEPFDKAGSYGIQGLGGLLVQKIEGDYWNVVGLPAGRLKRELSACGIL